METTNLDGIGMTSQRTRERLIRQLRKQGITNEKVLAVMRRTPRHIFVDEALASRAYENTALPIGHGQTISQPYIVAKMTSMLLADFTPKRVLEVGTGCGYQTAILAQLVEEVYSVERIAVLLQQAKKRFRRLHLYNIKTQHSDGNWGWESKAPFDAILVTAAPQQVPESLLRQLDYGGRLVIPVGSAHQQRLRMIVRRAGHYERIDDEFVSFVPLLAGKI